MNAEWRNRYELAIQSARQAGRQALACFQSDMHVMWKADCSPVTQADRDAEKALRNQLGRHFPTDGYLGEEFGETPGDSGYRWVIDPIDGTRNYLRGIPLWGTLIGLQFEGECIAGVAYLPALDQMFRALKGDGAYRDQQRIHVSNVNRLDRGQLFYSSLAWFVKAGRQDAFVELVKRTERQRGFGDCYGFLLVAQGSGELMVEHGVHVWDVAALAPIIEEAGGQLTDWKGSRSVQGPDVIASNGVLHDQALTILNDVS